MNLSSSSSSAATFGGTDLIDPFFMRTAMLPPLIISKRAPWADSSPDRNSTAVSPAFRCACDDSKSMIYSCGTKGTRPARASQQRIKNRDGNAVLRRASNHSGHRDVLHGTSAVGVRGERAASDGRVQNAKRYEANALQHATRQHVQHGCSPWQVRKKQSLTLAPCCSRWR